MSLASQVRCAAHCALLREMGGVSSSQRFFPGSEGKIWILNTMAHTYVCICVHMCIYIYLYIYICVYIYLFIYLYICIYSTPSDLVVQFVLRWAHHHDRVDSLTSVTQVRQCGCI